MPPPAFGECAVLNDGRRVIAPWNAPGLWIGDTQLEIAQVRMPDAALTLGGAVWVSATPQVDGPVHVLLWQAGLASRWALPVAAFGARTIVRAEGESCRVACTTSASTWRCFQVDPDGTITAIEQGVILDGSGARGMRDWDGAGHPRPLTPLNGLLEGHPVRSIVRAPLVQIACALFQPPQTVVEIGGTLGTLILAEIDQLSPRVSANGQWWCGVWYDPPALHGGAIPATAPPLIEGVPVPPPTVLPPKGTITDWTPKSGTIPFTVTALWAKEAGSGPIKTVQWLLNGSIVAPNNSPDDPDHHYQITMPGDHRIDLRVIGFDGQTSQTAKLRLIHAESPHPTPPIPPTPEPVPPTPGPGQVLVHVTDTMTTQPIAGADTWSQVTPGTIVPTNAQGYALITASTSGVCAKKDGYHSPGLPDQIQTCKVLASLIELGLQPVPPPIPPARTGVVTSANHVLQDGDGQHCFLGATAFWYLGGYRTDKPRVTQHCDWWKSKGIDYLRILCHASGSGADAYASTFKEDLTGLVDLAYAHGLRSQITIFGQFNGTKDQRQQVVNAVRDLCQARPERLFAVEIANEPDSIGFPLAEAREYARQLLIALPHQIAVGARDESCEGQQATYGGLSPISKVLVTIHYSRSTSGDGGLWDPPTQPWRGGHQFCIGGERIADNEGIGYSSSVKQDNDPRRLATTLAVDLIGGGGCRVIHVGSGVTGKAEGPTPSRPWPRPANAWEEINIDAGLKAQNAVRALFPPDAPNWTRGASKDGPFEVTSGLGPNGTMDRFYWSWNTVEGRGAGVNVRRPTTCRARKPLEATVYDTLDGHVILQAMLTTGQSITLSPEVPGVVVAARFL